ncbi:doubled CXXCH domain protein [Desulfurivibrio alkaliphilus AHT 2]|uniref:Doubled CXXCH domain protein n=1 Tax=Desulfurivibrio alkaliphilus (strain DSM 19089 / UNIQEM U267 / AHT2) TaxID=589865 RepID=D6YZT8_DESAT|nr:doubled CXXCH domain protein [Desulfurivibrio alkaliphilus AHT 2]
MNRLPQAKKLPPLLLVIVVLVFLPPASAADPDFKQCRNCHNSALERDTFRLYQHPVFNRGQCTSCHSPSSLKEVLPAAPQQAAAPENETVQWLGDSLLADTNHWFLVGGEDLKSRLVVETRGNRRLPARWELLVPPLAGIDSVADRGRAPVITELQVLEIRRGLFLTATIGWQTDSISDARVRYGSTELNRTSPAHNRLGRRHQVVLRDLQPNQTYHFAAVSRDLFGRRQESETLTFTTTSPRLGSQPSTSLSPAETDSRQAEPEIIYQRHGDNFLLQLTFEQPAMVAVGSSGPPRQETALITDQQTMEPEEKADHSMLNSQADTTITACIQCHQGRLGTATHPVNVYPPPGMVIPPTYPTLPDGRITCISCHRRHGSSNAYILIRSGQRELCLGCHQNMR